MPVIEDPNGVGWTVSAAYDPGLKVYLVATEHDTSFASKLSLLVSQTSGRAVGDGSLHDARRPAGSGVEHRVPLRLPGELVLEGREALHAGVHGHRQRRRAQPDRRLVHREGRRGRRRVGERQRNGNGNGSGDGNGSGNGSDGSGTGCNTSTTCSSTTQSSSSGSRLHRRTPPARAGPPAPRAGPPARRHAATPAPRPTPAAPGPARTRPSDTFTTFAGGGYYGSSSGQTTGQQGSRDATQQGSQSTGTGSASFSLDPRSFRRDTDTEPGGRRPRRAVATPAGRGC